MPRYPRWLSRLNEILKLWGNREVLRFSEIHKGLVELGIVKPRDKKKTVRILNGLMQRGLVEKASEGYRLTVKPKQFNMIEYIGKLVKHYGAKRYIYEGRVGGRFWSLAELMLIGFPDLDRERLRKLEEVYPALRLTMEVLMVRLARIYDALRELAYILRARLEGKRIDRFSELRDIRERILRETLLELVPYYLGDRAGVEGDGLPTIDLIEAYEAMMEALPEHVMFNIQPVGKENLKEIFNSVKAFAEVLAESMREEAESGRYDWVVNDHDGGYHDFILVVGPPRELVNWNEENFRRLLLNMEEAKKCGIKSPIFYAYFIYTNYPKREEAEAALERLHLLGLIDKYERTRIREILEYYWEGRKLRSIVERYLWVEKRRRLLEKGYAPGRYGIVNGKILPLEEAEKVFKEISEREGEASMEFLTIPDKSKLEKYRSKLIEKLNNIDMDKAAIGVWLFKQWPLTEKVKNKTIDNIVKAVKGLMPSVNAESLREKLEKEYKVTSELLKERKECMRKFIKYIVERLEKANPST